MERFIDILKKLLPYFVAGVVFALLAVLYCLPVLDGKDLNQSDIVQWKGMAHEVMDYQDVTGRNVAWTGSAFSGMPAYQIAKSNPGDGFSMAVNAVVDFLKQLISLFFDSAIGLIIAYFICFFILMRSFGVNGWVSIVGAVAIAFSSYFFIIIAAGHETKAMTLAYMAPVIAGFYLVFRKKYLVGMCLTMLFSSIGIMRHPQMAYYMFLIIGVFFVAEIFIHIREKRYKDLAVAVLLFAVSAGVGVGTNYSKLKSNSEYVKETMRGGHSEIVREGEQATEAGLSLEYATQWSYGIDETFTLMIPDFKGGSSSTSVGMNSNIYRKMVAKGVAPGSAAKLAEALPTYWGEQPFTSGPVYVGAIVCFLFILGICIVRGPYKWALLICTVFSILLSWGNNWMGLTEFFFKWFPYYNKFRAVSSILVVAEITMPLLGFLAIKEIMDGEAGRLKVRIGIIISAAVTVGLCLSFGLFGTSIFGFTSSGDAKTFAGTPGWFIEELLLLRVNMFRFDCFRSAALILAAAAVVWFFAKGKIRTAAFVPLLGLLIVADMWLVDKRYFKDSDFVSVKEDNDYFEMTPIEEELLQDSDYFRVYDVTSSPFNDARTSYYLKSIGGYHAAKLRRYQDLIDEHITKGNMSVIDMLNTKYIIKDSDEGLYAEYNPGHLGNAWFVDTVFAVATPTEESDALNSIDPATVAVTDEKFSSFILSPVPAPDDSAYIEFVKYDPDRLEYRSHSSVEKTAVFSEIYYPYGWKSYIDGRESEHFRVDYVLRAMNIPAGDHEIVFEFRPESLYKGYKVSAGFNCIMLLFILSSLVFGVRRFLRTEEKIEEE